MNILVYVRSNMRTKATAISVHVIVKVKDPLPPSAGTDGLVGSWLDIVIEITKSVPGELVYGCDLLNTSRTN